MRAGSIRHTLRDALGPLVVIAGVMGALMAGLLLLGVTAPEPPPETDVECSSLGVRTYGSLRLTGCRFDLDEALVLERETGLVGSLLGQDVEAIILPLRAADAPEGGPVAAWLAVSRGTDLEELARRAELFGDVGRPPVAQGPTSSTNAPTSSSGRRAPSSGGVARSRSPALQPRSSSRSRSCRSGCGRIARGRARRRARQQECTRM